VIIGDNLTKPYIEGGVDTMKKLTDEQVQELAKELQREYLRSWRMRNPEKIKEYNQRYWRKKALEMLKEHQEDALERG